MNWIHRLVNEKNKKRRDEINTKLKAKKGLKISYVLDLLKMITLGVSAILIIVYISAYCLIRGNISIPSFWVAWMSLWMLSYSAGKKLLKNEYAAYVDVLFVIVVFLETFIACVIIINEWYSDFGSLVVSIIGFSITIIIEVIDSIKMFKNYYDEKIKKKDEEIEELNNKSPLS